VIRKACYVACDGPCGGDPAEVAVGGAAEARAYARADGYVRVKVDGRLLDLCPRCAEAVR
jgi:hypothetical protein